MEGEGLVEPDERALGAAARVAFGLLGLALAGAGLVVGFFAAGADTSLLLYPQEVRLPSIAAAPRTAAMNSAWGPEKVCLTHSREAAKEGRCDAS